MVTLVFCTAAMQMVVASLPCWLCAHCGVVETEPRLGASEKLMGPLLGSTQVTLRCPPKMGSWIVPPTRSRQEPAGSEVGRYGV